MLHIHILCLTVSAVLLE